MRVTIKLDNDVADGFRIVRQYGDKDTVFTIEGEDAAIAAFYVELNDKLGDEWV